MSFFSLIALVSSLTFASRGDSVPVPQVAHGETLLMIEAAVMDDGTWIVKELEDRLWWSRTLGTKWERVPGVPIGGSGRLFGKAVVSQSNSWFWTFDGGWQKVVMPPVCAQPKVWTISPEGMLGVYDEERKVVTYCRSTDGLRTWTEWFSPPNASLPKDTTAWLGEDWNGKVWYRIVDSGYMRGTSDGMVWSRVLLPAGFLSTTFVQVSPESQTLVILGGSSWSDRNRVAITRDLGANWDIHSAYEPGWMVRKLANNLFFTVALDSVKRRKQWLSASETGPWTFLDADFQGVLYAQDQRPYVVERTAISRVVLEGLSGMDLPKAPEWKIGRANRDLLVEPFPSTAPRFWSLRSLDGRKLAEGRLEGGRIEVPGHLRGTMLLTVGRRTRAIHWF
ncbi:MAG: hypothetical protein IPK50_03540 [Fibrobacterota bacterium]|nr:hypothetical protein [Fibrobacterota bacterium]QQS05968.1 MAG: hypothetical protein IPK50_03540 [Fibrobacterota bacterium]